MRSVWTLFLALYILGRFNHSVAIIEPDPSAPAVDTDSTFFANDEVSSDDCSNYDVDIRSKDKLRARGDTCGTSPRRGTAPDGESPANELVNPETGKGSDNPWGNQPKNPDEEHSSQQPNPNDPVTPKNQPPFTEFLNDPHLQCLKFLGGLLKYAVCDSGSLDDIIWRPLPEVMEGVPFFELHHCSLGTFDLDRFGLINDFLDNGQFCAVVLPFSICPARKSFVWCCYDYDVILNQGFAVGCIQLWYLQYTGGISFPDFR